MASTNLRLAVDLVNRRAEQGINRLTQALRSMSGAELNATQRLFYFSQNMTMAANTARDAFDVLKQGAVGLELKDSFREQVTQAGQSLEVFMGKLREASGGTINNFNLMSSAAKAMSLGVTTDADQMAEVLEIARFKARKFGRDTADAFEDIAIGIGRTSPLILDNLGILTGGEATFKAYAASIGKAGDKLTDVEKRQALLNKVLIEGRKEMAAAGGMTDSTADQYRKLTAELDNAKGAWTGIIAVAASAPVFGGQNIGGVMSGRAERFKEIQALETAFDGLQQSIQLTTTQEWSLWLKRVTGNVEGFKAQLETIPGALYAWDASLAEATDKLGLTEGALTNVRQGFSEAEKEWSQGNAITNFVQQLEQLQSSEVDGAYLGGLVEDVQHFNQTIAEGRFEELQANLQQYPSVIGEATQAFANVALAQNLTKEEALALASEYGNLINQELLLAAYNAELAEQVAQVSWAMIEGNNAAGELATGMETATASQQLLIDSNYQASMAMIEGNYAAGELVTGMEGVSGRSILAAADIGALSEQLFRNAAEQGMTAQEAINLANDLGVVTDSSIGAQIAFVELAIAEGMTAEEAINLAQESGIVTEITQQLATAAIQAQMGLLAEGDAAYRLSDALVVAASKTRLLADGLSRISGARSRMDAGFALEEAQTKFDTLRAGAPSGGSAATLAQYEAKLWEAKEALEQAQERVDREGTIGNVGVGLSSDIPIVTSLPKADIEAQRKEIEREAEKQRKEQEKAAKAQESAANKAAKAQESAANKAAKAKESAAKKAQREQEKAAKEQERALKQQQQEQERYNKALENALKKEQDMLSQGDDNYALTRHQSDLAKLQASPPDPNDALASTEHRNAILETEKAIADAQKRIADTHEKAAQEQERALEQQQQEQEQYNSDLANAVKQEKDILSQRDDSYALNRYQNELAELKANPPDADDALAWARYRNEVLETEDAIAAAQKRISDEQAKLVAEQEKAAEKARKEQEKAAEEAEKAWQKTLDTLQKEWDKAVGEVRGAVDGAIDLSIGVSEEDMMLAELGLYEDKVNEAGRRLEDVINRGADSPWVGTFGELIGLEGDALKAGAIKLQQDIEDFLNPEHLNKGAILENARRSLIGDRNRQALVDDLTKQLVEEGWAEFDAAQALGASTGMEIPMPPISFAPGDQQRIAEEMGVAFVAAGQVAGQELISTLVQTMNNQMEAQEKNIEAQGRRFAEYLVRGAEEGVQDNEVIGKLQEAITLNIMRLMAHVGMGMGGGA